MMIKRGGVDRLVRIAVGVWSVPLPAAICWLRHEYQARVSNHLAASSGDGLYLIAMPFASMDTNDARIDCGRACER